MTNELILSCSSDKTLRVWNLKSLKCIKQINTSNELLCCCFHPLNNLLVAVGTKNSFVVFYNYKNGKEISRARIESPARAMVFSTDGQWLYLGCGDGKVRWFTAVKDFQDFKYGGSSRLSNRPINSISYRDDHTPDKKVPALLVNIADSTVRIVRVNHSSGDKVVTPWVICHNVNVSTTIHSSFSSLMLFRRESYFATGSEDNNVYIYAYPTDPGKTNSKQLDVSKGHGGPSKQVDVLQGHGGPVTDVAWNNDETLLASSDTTGWVIVWKRVKEIK